ncbi:MAG: UvrD-helicase domain-containing protein [Coleofasciculus sp. G3-WIS-01]|uniref:UvrD-helicase domain-containing protein n=1 Tax=Coleofasciculus sp. G3-WIS-01 TaxID=3069528 RepID=UPI0032FE8025
MNSTNIPVQSYHALEFHPIPPEQSHDYKYALNEICTILAAEMNPATSRAIIFINNRLKCEEYADKLNQQFQEAGQRNFRVGFYHAGMKPEARQETEEEFREGTKVVILATKAFGMGIDVPNIHFAFHLQPPDSLEDYLQEIGRAGRNEQKRQDAELRDDKVRCILFYSKESFAKARSQMQRNRLHWSDIEAMRVAIADYQTQFANRSNSLIIPADLITESDSLKDKTNPETTQRMLLHWLEKLGRIELGDRVVSHVDLSLGVANLSTHSSLGERIRDRGGTTEKWVSLSLLDIQTCLNLNSFSEVFQELFRLHQQGIICWHRHFRIKMTKFGQTEMASDKDKLWLNVYQFLLQLIGEWRQKSLNVKISQSDIEKRFTQKASELFPRSNESPTPEERRFLKSWTPMVRLLNKLDGIKISTRLERGIIYDIRIQSNDLDKKLDRIQKICQQILPLIKQGHEQQKTINLGDLMQAAAIDNPDRLKAALYWIRSLGYIAYQQDFLPTSLSVKIQKRFTEAVLEENINQSDSQIQEDFNNYFLLKEWRLNALATLTEVPESHQREFIKDYFACKNIAEIQDLILNQLSGNSRLGQQLRQDAFEKAIAELNKEQKEIVEACPRNSLIVIAGPGTGKTKTLLLCVAYLIVKQWENPADILVLAYNAAVVAELRSRLSRLLRDLGYASAYGSLPIYTFHGYVRRTLGNQLDENCSLENYPAKYLEITQTNKSLIRPDSRDAPHYIFIDEYQDITQERYEMLRRIKSDNTKLIAIGDDDQSIYGYERKNGKESKSSVSYFKRFEQEFDAHKKSLFINYRALSPLLDVTEAYISRNCHRLRQNQLQSGRRDEETLTGEVKLEKANNAHLQKILEAIDELLKRPHLCSLAVLFRTNPELYRILGDIRDRFGKRTYIRVQGGRERFADLREVAVLLDQLKQNPEQKIGSFAVNIEERTQECLKPYQGVWSKSSYEFLEKAALSFEESYSPDTPISEFIEQIEDIRHLSELTWFSKQYQQQNQPGKPEIILSTIHKIKGLEFDAVLIPAADCSKDISDKEEIEEERRVRYVAMTRARDYLYLIEGEREERLAAGQPIKAKENGQLGLKFDSGDSYVTNNEVMFTLFNFANDNYARFKTQRELTNGKGQGLQDLIFQQIGEGDPLELIWDRGRNQSYYHLFHPILRTKIGRVTPENSTYIRQWFPNQNGLQLQGIRVTSISRFRVPKEGENGFKFNQNLCQSVLAQGYYYIVNCAGYLRSEDDF